MRIQSTQSHNKIPLMSASYMISQILPNLTLWHKYAFSLEMEKFCHIFSNFIKRRKKWKQTRTQCEADQAKLNYEKATLFFIHHEVRIHFYLRRLILANVAMAITTSKQTSEFSSWSRLRWPHLISILSQVLFEKFPCDQQSSTQH